MKWKPGRRSENLEDRRGERARGRVRFPFPMGRSGGGSGRLPGGRAPKLSLGGILILLLLVFATRGQILELLAAGAGGSLDVPLSPTQSAPGAGTPAAPGEEPLVDFVSFVLDDVQQSWLGLLPQYREAKLVLFRDAVRSGCGFAGAQMGPFYCPVDEKVYIDLGFYEELKRRFGAPGDFAQAYVLAHEIGHHVQKVLGIEAEVRRLQQARPERANELSVRMELQADCLAGVWASTAGRRDILEPGDVEEGLRAAEAIGDDAIQRQTTGRVRPESFTHGSSEQRQQWLQRGLGSGDLDACDSFAGV